MPFFPNGDPENRLLFNDAPLGILIEQRQQLIDSEVLGHPVEALLKTPTDDIVTPLVRANLPKVPALKREKAYQEPPLEVWRSTTRDGIQASMRGFEYQLTIPFEGDRSFFLHTSPHRPALPSRAVLGAQEIILKLGGYDLSPEEVKQELDRRIAVIEACLSSQRNLIREIADRLQRQTRAAVEKRKKDVLESRKVAAFLGYPMIRSDRVPMTHVPSSVRRKIRPVRAPKKVAAPFVPEPALEEAEYQYILKIVEDMSVMMERSPSAFKRLEEEHLRDFFLLVLNGHYEGKATGETFNTKGKTDILIREQNRNVFIAECKYWHGAKSVKDALDQLLSYLNWRDTKACLVVFSRTRGFSQMLTKLERAAGSHPLFKRGPTREAPGRLRYIFANRNDPEREVIVTIMAFDIPT